MPIQGGELNYNKDDNKKVSSEKTPSDGAQPLVDKAKEGANKVKEEVNKAKEKVSKAMDGSKKPEESKADDQKKDIKKDAKKEVEKDTPKPDMGISKENDLEKLQPKTQPMKNDTSKIESSKISSTDKEMAKPADRLSSKPEASGLIKQNDSRMGAVSKPDEAARKPVESAKPPSAPSAPGNFQAGGVAGALGQQKKPSNGSKDIGAAALSSSGKPSTNNPTNSSTKNVPQIQNDDDDRNPVIKFFIKIKNAITQFCCQTEDSLRHVA